MLALCSSCIPLSELGHDVYGPEKALAWVIDDVYRDGAIVVEVSVIAVGWRTEADTT